MTSEDGEPVSSSAYEDPESERLIERLAQAAQALVAAGRADPGAPREGYADLLNEAQQALLANSEKLRAAQAEASRQSALLTAVFDSAPDAILQTDERGIVRFLNRVKPGVRLEQVLNQSWPPRFASEEDRPAVRAALESVLSGGPAREAEWRFVEPNKPITWLASRIAPIRDRARVTGAVIISRDITEKKEADAQLLISDRMSSVGTLAAGVAHEVNNPLAAVIANLEAIAQDALELAATTSVPPDLLQAIADSQRAAERVKFIVRDLKVFSRVGGEAVAPIDPVQVLESTLRMANNEIRHRAVLVRDYQTVPLVNANEARLGQVFLNLIVNAAQSIPEGHFEANQIRVSTSIDSNGQVLVRIADTGVGIPLELQKKLFTPFFTTKEIGVGTGLGLSICQRLVTEMGGKISFSSVPGQGSEFRVHLPPSEGKPEAAPLTPAAKVEQTLQILVIDDDPMVLKAAQRLLAAEHVVTCAESALEAEEQLAQGKRFDVIFCDLMMPQVMGMDFHAQLAAREPRQAERVVFMTGGAFTPRAKAFLETTSNRYLEKPFTLDGLQRAISEVITTRA